MKKALLMFGVLAFVVNMGLSADNLSDGNKYVKMAKDMFGDLTPTQMHLIKSSIGSTVNILGKYSTSMDVYKYLADFKEVVDYSARYKDARTDAEKTAAGKAGSKSMLKVLEGFSILAGGQLYGVVFPVLLKQIDRLIDVMALHYAEIILEDYAASDPQKYGNPPLRWSDIAYSEYRPLAIQMLAKASNPRNVLADLVLVIYNMEDIKEQTGQRRTFPNRSGKY